MSDMRAMIRQILREELAHLRGPGGHQPVSQKTETVSITSDAELNRFAHRMLQLAQNPETGAAIRDGQHVFRLASGSSRAGHADPAAPTGQRQAGADVEKGLLTEKHVTALADGTKVLRLGKSVCLTPLAKDELRRKGIKIERIST
ncbi:hypothetical protein [Anderseniella sp. Alg231-50]|uniref:hypothetical protein n=1 Tax=Anderseniella sp. Alg231-50 TaxID=1922226 RepID=UPI000D55902E